MSKTATSMPNMQQQLKKLLLLLVKAIVTLNESFLLDVDVLGKYVTSSGH